MVDVERNEAVPLRELRLFPDSGVSVDIDGRLVATEIEPWLTLGDFDPSWRDAFIEITYRASLLDEPARPVFRFRLESGAAIDQIGVAPCVGSTWWIGRVPDRTISLSVSPTNRIGRFDFVVERVRRRSWLALLASVILRSPGYAWRALALRLIGFVPESDAMLAWAIGSSLPLCRYAAWRAERQRAFAVDGIDRPRCNWRRTNVACVVLSSGSEKDYSDTLASLRSQVFENWHAVGVYSEDAPCAPDKSLRTIGLEALCAEAQNWPTETLVCVLAAGDVLVEETFAYVAEQAERYPSDQVFYGDILEVENGRSAPWLMPGWSSRPSCNNSVLRRPVFMRASFLRSSPVCRDFLATGRVPAALTARGARPLRRMLAKTSRVDRRERVAVMQRMAGTVEGTSRDSTATIIVPTRGNPKLLTRLLASMRALRTSTAFELLIVNNGGARDAIEAVAAETGMARAVTVLDYPQPFNFSAICNAGVAASDGDVIVFLNDDVEVQSHDWLDRLVHHAMSPEVGAVGAKLVYPSGRLQHVGVVVGWGGYAGHFGAQAEGGDPGWAGRNTFVHEVGAVTGACLAVARSKYQAVGGFDEQAFPVELGDIDLCLRLRARGWPSLLDPTIRLKHAESRSRGRATFRRLATYAPERAVFCERWARVLRDDPYFHPGLSLYSWGPALG